MATAFSAAQMGRAVTKIWNAGIDEQVAHRGLLGLDAAAIEQLATQWLAVRRDERAAPNQRGRALTSYVIHHLLDGCRELGVPPPDALVELSSLHHEVETFARDEIGPNPGALALAVLYCRDHRDASDRQIAKAVGCSARTIARWRPMLAVMRRSRVLTPQEEFALICGIRTDADAASNTFCAAGAGQRRPC